MNKLAEKLADIIEANPNCMMNIDNDDWFITELSSEDDDDDERKVFAEASKFGYETLWYGHSSNYGFALAEAMIILLNRRGFNIQAAAV